MRPSFKELKQVYEKFTGLYAGDLKVRARTCGEEMVLDIEKRYASLILTEKEARALKKWLEDNLE